MPSALAYSSGGPTAPPLLDDLEAVGFVATELGDCSNLVRDVVEKGPDIVAIFEAHPDSALFDGIAAVAAAAPRPVVVFTTDPDAEKMARAARSGVHAYVVNGFTLGRLRSVIQVAQARFREERRVLDELADLNRRFAERTLVDRAKGILMGARQLREEEAYRALRSAAMDGKQRIGQVARQVIDGARYAEAVNRAGQLRMLSQRLVKLYALACLGVRPPETRTLFDASVAQVDANLATLSRALSEATFGDLLSATNAPWATLKAAVTSPAERRRLGEVDALAEQLLEQAEQLTRNLEITGLAAALHVVNVTGRQRMLSQRLAKCALLSALLDGDAAADARAAMGVAATEFLDGFAYLDALPLSNAAIAGEVARATAAWDSFRAAAAVIDTPAGQDGVAGDSETMLAHLDALTDHIERGVQALTL